MFTSNRKVDECRPLIDGVPAGSYTAAGYALARSVNLLNYGDGGASPNIALGTWPLCHCCDMLYNGYLDHVRIWTARLPGRGVTEKHTTDVESTNRVRAFV